MTRSSFMGKTRGQRLRGRRQTAAAAIGAAAFAMMSFLTLRADAHAVGLSTGEYTATGDSVFVKMAFARGEVASILPSLDENRDGHVTAFEVESAKHDFETKVLTKVHVSAGGSPCTPVLLSAALTEADGLAIDGRYDCSSANQPFEIDVKLLDDLSHGHRHIARAIGATTHDEVLYKGHSAFTIIPGAGGGGDAPAGAGGASSAAGAAGSAAAGVTTAAAAAEPSHLSSAWAFFKMGIEHILTGYDHLVFLLGLLLLRARLKQLLAVITAFTVAHSITLAIAVLGIFTPSPRFVEPAIALSIMYVGIENFFVKDGSGRWRITFPFGLIHGFGFAGALTEIHLPHAQIPTALVSFNLGVEAGQLFAMSLVLPMIMLLRKKWAWFEPRGVQVVSAAVAIAGGVWFVLRIAAG